MSLASTTLEVTRAVSRLLFLNSKANPNLIHTVAAIFGTLWVYATAARAIISQWVLLEELYYLPFAFFYMLNELLQNSMSKSISPIKHKKRLTL